MNSEGPLRRSEAALDLRPWLGAFLILIGATWFMPTEASLRGGVGMPLNVLCFVWFAALLAFFSFQIPSQKLAVLANWSLVDRLWLCFFVWHTLSVLLGWHYRWLEPRPAIGLMWQQLAMAVIYFGGRLIVRAEESRVVVVQCLVALGVGVSLFSWYQYLVVLPEVHQQYRSATELEKIAQLAGAGITDTEPGSRMRELFESRLFNREPFGTFSLTNTLAAILVPAALLALFNGLDEGRCRRWVVATWWLTAWALISGTMALTSSRTAILAFVLTVLMWIANRLRLGAWLPLRGRLAWCGVWMLIGLPIVIVVGLWAVGQSDSRLFSGAPQSVQYRLQYWVASSQMIAARPWFGWGPGNFQSAYAGFQPPEASETIADPHNFFFEIAATAGLPAALIFLTSVALSLYRGREEKTAVSHAIRDSESKSRAGDCESSEGEFSARAESGSSKGPLWQPWLILPGGLTLGLGCSWLGESLPAPLLYLAAAVLLAAGWWAIVRAFPSSAIMSGPAVRNQVSSDAARWALLGLMISLLASGGINYPAIGSCVVLLAAVAVTNAEQDRPQTKRRVEAGWLWRQRATWQVLAIGLAALAAYMYSFDTLPVIRSEWSVQRARQQLAMGNGSAGQHELRIAQQLDPWRGDTHVDLAVLDLMGRANELGDARFRADTDKKLQAAAAYRPASSPARRRFAEAYLQQAAVTRDSSLRRELLKLAKDWLEDAVQRKPVDAGLVAQWSWLQLTLGEEAEAIQSAERVRILGQLNPHPDLRLDQQWFLAIESAIPSSLLTESRPVDRLRNGLVQINVERWIQWVLARDVTAK